MGIRKKALRGKLVFLLRQLKADSEAMPMESSHASAGVVEGTAEAADAEAGAGAEAEGTAEEAPEPVAKRKSRKESSSNVPKATGGGRKTSKLRKDRSVEI